jgi:MoaA/NifB/PqqE/SkfB family radical SAM enzyme
MSGSSIPLLLPRIRDKTLEFKKYLNFLLALIERRNNAKIVSSLPFEITIDPSTTCQLACPYCSLGAKTMQRTKGILHPPLHYQMLHDLSDSLFIIWYFSTGEPLLNKFLPELIRATKDKDIYTVISTNLSLKLSDERIDQLLTCGLGCISVSLDGASAEIYSRYRVGGDFNLVIHNLQRLIKRKRELGLTLPYLEWRFLIFRHNTHQISEARLMATEMGVDILEFFYGNAPPDAKDDAVQLAEPMDLTPSISGTAITQALQRPPTTLLNAMNNYTPSMITRTLESIRSFVKKSKLFKKPSQTVLNSVLHNEFNRKCDWLYFGSTLFPNGAVGPCCLSNEEIDDFGLITANTDFRTVWNNELYQEARALYSNQQWNQTKLVCARCPDSKARDYQFRTTLQALLRNAPDWVLRVMIADINRFFFPIDKYLFPIELEALTRCKQFLITDFKSESYELSQIAKQSSLEINQHLRWMIKILST